MQDRARERNTEMTGFGSSLVALRLGIWYCHCYGKQLPHAEGVAKTFKNEVGKSSRIEPFTCVVCANNVELNCRIPLVSVVGRLVGVGGKKSHMCGIRSAASKNISGGIMKAPWASPSL